MSDLHNLCKLSQRPLTREQCVEPLSKMLRAGIPATYTLEEAEAYERGEEDASQGSTTTPMHILCENVPLDATSEEEAVILAMMDELWLFGAGWCLTNANDETPACVLLRRGLHGSKYWESCVDSGVRAEVLLRKIEESTVEFLDGPEDAGADASAEQNQDIPELVEENAHEENAHVANEANAATTEGTGESGTGEDSAGDLAPALDAATSTSTYLATKLHYTDDALVTATNSDGVMMQWEDILMQAGCDSLFSSTPDPEVNVLNIGFGMGIIDTMIQTKTPTHHYICEAHPDVLAKLRADGWHDKPNVTVLEGKWQDTLPELLTKGLFFDGIYYDTYSEHYSDMLNDLFDVVVGLLKPEGTFSFFNGLGADRLVCYEVYRKVVDLDLANYGLQVKFKPILAPKSTLEETDATGDSVWDTIRRPYWRCPIYYHPEARFMQ